MSFHSIAIKALFLISSLIGVEPVHTGPHADLWRTVGGWKREGAYLTFEASSEKITDLCRQTPSGVVEFPEVVQGAHEFRLDGHLIKIYGDRTFETVEKFYGRPVVDCSLLTAGKSLEWKVSSFADYFARIYNLPTVSGRRSSFNLFAETFHTVAAGAMIIMAIYTLFLFSGAVSTILTLSVFLSCVLMSFYFLACASDDFGLTFNMLTMHKFADSSVWCGILMLFFAYFLEGLLTRTGLAIYAFSVVVGASLIFLGASGDEVQLGTVIPCFTGLQTIFSMLFIARVNDRAWWSDRQKTLQLVSLIAFISGLLYETFTLAGLFVAPPMLPVTLTGGVLFLIFSVNQRITKTYQERDHLRENLQQEVDLKTTELREALGSLKSTQAELVQSAKLASLGTLSAGIAHEINNSLNYVNGALLPLQRIVQLSPDLKENTKVTKLFGAMNEGMRLSVDIVASLRNYTGLNQAKFNDIRLMTIVKSVLTILKPKLGSKVEVAIEIPDGLSIFGSVVGLNQVFMNLISNAVDAMPEGGRLAIAAQQLESGVEITVRDSGTGIEKKVVERIFEPFYTTKDVGKGTGLGLHIVKNEIEKHKGTISVASEIGKGTTFTISLPKISDADVIESVEKKAS